MSASELFKFVLYKFSHYYYYYYRFNNFNGLKTDKLNIKVGVELGLQFL